MVKTKLLVESCNLIRAMGLVNFTLEWNYPARDYGTNIKLGLYSMVSVSSNWKRKQKSINLE